MLLRNSQVGVCIAAVRIALGACLTLLKLYHAMCVDMMPALSHAVGYYDAVMHASGYDGAVCNSPNKLVFEAKCPLYAWEALLPRAFSRVLRVLHLCL